MSEAHPFIRKPFELRGQSVHFPGRASGLFRIGRHLLNQFVHLCPSMVHLLDPRTYSSETSLQATLHITHKTCKKTAW
jgi:hypothetical protein